jgi:hypothetical protein
VRILVSYQWTPLNAGKGFRYKHNHDFNIAWTDVMSVCRHFRSVAVGSPELWNTICTDAPSDTNDGDDLAMQRSDAIMKLCLSRAGTRSLILIGSGDSLHTLLERAKVAHLEILNLDLFQNSEATGFMKQAHFLSDLVLRCGYQNMEGSFLGGQSTQLVRLNLRYATLVGLPSLPSLIHLSLTGVTLSGLKVLAESLKQTPHLKTLIIVDCYLSRTLPQKSIVRKGVNLMDLQILHLSLEDVAFMSAILQLVPRPKLYLVVNDASVDISPHLTKHHGDIFTSCLDMWRSNSNAPFPPCHLTFLVGREKKSPIPPLVEHGYMGIGSELAWDDMEMVRREDALAATSKEGSTSYSGPFLEYRSKFKVSKSKNGKGHPCLQHIRELHFLGDGLKGVPWRNRETSNLGLESLPALERVIINQHVSTSDLASIHLFLKSRSTRRAPLIKGAGIVRPTNSDSNSATHMENGMHLTVHTIDCSKEVQRRVEGWLKDPALMIGKVTCSIPPSLKSPYTRS